MNEPFEGASYFHVLGDGSVIENIYNTDYDVQAVLIGNHFITVEEAQAASEKLKIYYEFKKYVYEHDPNPITEEDWKGDPLKAAMIRPHFKYSIYYDEVLDKIYTEVCQDFKRCFNIYASDSNIIKNAIKYIGEDRLKKLFK